MKKEPKKIMLVGGGTLGSVSPLLAVAEKYPADYLFVGSKFGPEEVVVLSHKLRFQKIISGKFRRYWSMKNVWDVFKIKLAFWQSLKIILDFKPDIVLTAGSFVAMPVAWAAWFLRVPVIVHQQDIKVGLANKMMAPVARKITVTFADQQNLFTKKKIVVTGNPVRKILPANINEPIILITGGGLGARGFNDFVAEFIPRLTKYYPVHHVLGSNNWHQALSLPNYYPHKFLTDEMLPLLARAEIVISRAGMSLITEAAAAKKALVLVPIPDSHQEANAEFLAKHNAAILVKQDSDKIFARYLDKLLASAELRQELGKNLYNLFPAQAVDNYIKLIEDIIID